MNAIREWSAGICLAALTAALAQGLVPGGPMERMEKFVVGAFLVCALIAPVTKLVPSFQQAVGNAESDAAPSSRMEETVDGQIRSAAEKSISNLVGAELARKNIKCKNVRVEMDTNEDGRISITKVTVTLIPGDSSRVREAQEILTERLGVRTEVVSDDG